MRGGQIYKLFMRGFFWILCTINY